MKLKFEAGENVFTCKVIENGSVLESLIWMGMTNGGTSGPGKTGLSYDQARLLADRYEEIDLGDVRSSDNLDSFWYFCNAYIKEDLDSIKGAIEKSYAFKLREVDRYEEIGKINIDNTTMGNIYGPVCKADNHMQPGYRPESELGRDDRKQAWLEYYADAVDINDLTFGWLTCEDATGIVEWEEEPEWDNNLSEWLISGEYLGNYNIFGNLSDYNITDYENSLASVQELKDYVESLDKEAELSKCSGSVSMSLSQVREKPSEDSDTASFKGFDFVLFNSLFSENLNKHISDLANKNRKYKEEIAKLESASEARNIKITQPQIMVELSDQQIIKANHNKTLQEYRDSQKPKPYEAPKPKTHDSVSGLGVMSAMKGFKL